MGSLLAQQGFSAAFTPSVGLGGGDLDGTMPLAEAVAETASKTSTKSRSNPACMKRSAAPES